MWLKHLSQFKSGMFGIVVLGLTSMAGCGVKGPPVPYVTEEETEGALEKNPKVEVGIQPDKAQVPLSRTPIGKPQGSGDKKGKGRL